ncbi:hypothetical protein ACP70R_007989 [Stipagrostis hirtigluma subsp. patula]
MASWAMLYMRSDKAVLHPYGCKFLYSSFCSNYFQLAQWSMEPAAVWVPYDFQLANWSMEPAVWVPGLPVESASTELFGSYLQTSVPSSSKGQLVEYATATENDRIEKAAPDFEVDFHKMEMKIDVLNHEFKKAANEFQLDMSPSCLKMKMHRYPAAIQALYDERYVPKMVSIGPYHHGSDNVKQAEKVKHVAAYHCIRESGHSVQEIYDAVVSVAYDARNLYDNDAVAGIGDNDFLPMMFYDACFLVQYMLSCTTTGRDEMDPSLCTFLDSNDYYISHDVMLLENQLPWRVVQTVMRFRSVELEDFIDSWKDCLQDRMGKQNPVVLDGNYEPPHLLGLLRYYIVGRSNSKLNPRTPKTISFSVSAIELAEMGITLTTRKTTELIHMGVEKKGTLFPELSLVPLSLDDARASILVNLAALELCTTPDFYEAEDEESAVCSYLRLLAMLVDREEDVHELRTKHVLQGGGGLTDKDALKFFTSLQHLRGGPCYYETMKEIQNYKETRRMQTKLHAFVYKNMKTIVMVCSAIGALVSILETIKSLKGH